VLAEWRIRQKHTAFALRNAPDAAPIVTPIEVESERIYVILGGPLDTGNRDLWNCLRKMRKHVLQLMPILAVERDWV
jgi:hypothetical protein